VISLTVQDEGSGFDTARAKEAGGLGLISIEERVRLLDGRLEVNSQPGKGTTLHITLPYSHELPAAAPPARAESAAVAVAAS
jgi:signal transduction histidine kinase